MAERVIQKSLAGRQDILFGHGQVNQTRAGGLYPINKVSMVWACETHAELLTLDTTQFTQATVSYQGAVTHWGWTGTHWYCQETDLTLVGSFEAGFTLTAANQVGCTTSGIYSWSGVFPKVVNAGSTPTPLGSGGWVDRTDGALRGDLAGDAGTGLVWYKRLSGVARSLLYWMFDQPASIKDYGAKVDGITDDTAAILLAATTAKRIYIPDTGYPAIVDGLVLEGISGLEIKGPGTLKSKALSTTPTLRIRSCDDWKVSGIKIDGNKANRDIPTSRNSGAGLSISNCQGYSVSRVEVFEGVSGAGIVAIDDGPGTGDFPKPSSVKYCHIHDCGKATSGNGLSDGMFLNQDNMSVHFNYIHDCTDYGIAGDYARNMSIRWNRINNALVGVGVLGAKFWDVSFNWISNVGQGVSVTLSGNAASDPLISRVVRIYGNWISNVTRAASGTPNGDAVFVDPSAVDVDIQRNFVDTAYRGLASSAPGTKIIGNTVTNCTDKGIFNSGAGSVSRDNTLTATGGEYYGTTEADKDVQGGGFKSRVIVSNFIGGWTSASGSFAPAYYYKRDGRIFLGGSINPGTQSAAQPIFIIPQGFRPSATMRFSVTSENNIIYVLQVSTDGYVTYRSGTGGTNIQLDQISFPVA